MLKLGKRTLLSVVAFVSLSSSTYASDKIYAVVNGDKIQSSDIAVALRNPQLNFDSIPKDQQKKILKSLVEQKVLSQYASELKSVTNSDDYKIQLAKLKQNLALQLWFQDQSKNIKVSNDELKKYYKNNKSKFKKPLELKASHILVKTKEEAKKIIKLLDKASNKKETFIKLAKEKSTGPSGKTGGELGWFTKDKMVPEFSAAAVMLKKGTYTKEPVKTQFGYHIIFLDDRKDPSTLNFDVIKTKLKQEFLKNKFIDKIKEKAAKLIKKAKITYK